MLTIYNFKIVFELFQLKKKTKEATNLNVKILSFERQINIYTVAQKTRTNHFIPNHSFNF